jgi:signal transduction histidine kinase
MWGAVSHQFSLRHSTLASAAGPSSHKGFLLGRLAVVKQVGHSTMCRLVLFILARHRRHVSGVVVLLLTTLLALFITFIPPLFAFQLNNSFIFGFTLGALLIFAPLRAWLESRLERILHPERLAYQQIVEEYGQVMREMSDLEEILQYVAQTLYETSGAESVSVWLYHAEDQILLLSCFRGTIAADGLAELPVDIEPSRLYGTQRVSTVPESALRQGLMALGVRVITSMSLRDELIGVIGLGGHRFQGVPPPAVGPGGQASLRGKGHSDETLRLLDLMAGQSALAVKNACLIADLEATLNKLQLAYRRTIDAQEEERRSLAAELHDDILGRLTTMVLTLRNSRNCLVTDPDQVGCWLETLEKETQNVNRRLREITQGLHPSVLTDLGLISALRAYLDSLAKQPLLPSAPRAVTLTAQGFGDDRITDQKLEHDLYHITRQALDNAVMHAHAEQVFIHLRWGEDTVGVTVQDMGCGMKDASEVLMGQNGHLGLLSMNERVRAWGGRLTIHSVPDQGTTVRARLPIAQPSGTPTHLQAFTQHLVRPAPD